MITNYFMVAAAFLNLGGGLYYFWIGSPKLAVVFISYAVASAMFATIK